jgi:hypothetical protein
MAEDKSEPQELEKKREVDKATAVGAALGLVFGVPIFLEWPNVFTVALPVVLPVVGGFVLHRKAMRRS